MEDKFELVEDFLSPKRAKKEVNIVRRVTSYGERDHHDDDEWRPKYYKVSEHPLKLMVLFTFKWLITFSLPVFILPNRWILTEKIFLIIH